MAPIATRESHLAQFSEFARHRSGEQSPSAAGPPEPEAVDAAEPVAPEPDAPRLMVAHPIARPVADPVVGGSVWRDRLLQWRDDPRVLAAALATVALVAGVFFYRSAMAGEPASKSTATPTVTDAPASSPTTAGGEVVVHVSGAVATPGVYRLPTGARVGEAVSVAGGPAAGAEPDRLNLAARLADGQRVYVPRAGEAIPPEVGAVGGGEAGSAASGPVNLNTATSTQLEALPGIGPSLAAAIISERDRRGGFKSVNDLLSVRGIGEGRFADVKPLVVV